MMCAIEWLEAECFGAFAPTCSQPAERGQLGPGLGRLSEPGWFASPIGNELRIGRRILRVTADCRGVVLLDVVDYHHGWRYGAAVLAATCLIDEATLMAAWIGRLLANASAHPPRPVVWQHSNPPVIWTQAAHELCLRLAEERARAQRPGPAGDVGPVVDPLPLTEPTPE
jgi:hypothetical protein